MLTINAAYMLFREDEVGSLEPGKLADVIVLSANPLDVELDDLKDISVWMTMIGGETEYCAQGFEAYCP
jgi:predicted amidohydrolase YtcJ